MNWIKVEESKYTLEEILNYASVIERLNKQLWYLEQPLRRYVEEMEKHNQKQ